MLLPLNVLGLVRDALNFTNNGARDQKRKVWKNRRETLRGVVTADGLYHPERNGGRESPGWDENHAFGTLKATTTTMSQKFFS